MNRNYRAAMGGMGINGDTEVGHLTPGEFVVPRQAMTPKLWAALMESFDQQGIDPNQYMVGSPTAQMNPNTGAPMFAMRDYEQEGGFVDAGDVRGGAPEGWDTVPIPGHNPAYDYGNASTGTPTVSNFGSSSRDEDDGAVYSTLYQPEGAPFGVPLAPERPEVRKLVDDQYDDGLLSALDPFDYSVQYNPNTGTMGAERRLGIDPLFMGAGLLTGIPGLGFAADAIGIKDPLHVDIPMGFIGDTAAPSDLLEQNMARAASQDSIASFSRSAPAPSSPPAIGGGVLPPSILSPPAFLGLGGTFDPLQARSQIASFALNSDDSRYRGDDVARFYDSLLANALIDSQGNMLPLDTLLPVELQYLTQGRGLTFGSTKELFDRAGIKPGARPAGYSASAWNQLPQGMRDRLSRLQAA